ncbi:MAG TPA: radical SAM protein [Methanolinea sp.]|jgi:7-carboxy-7-deazaguanine synthase|nr:MAG: 7-carboxy-7-deazaguanine synthase [Methanoregulaceae archaeon PtaB.Bin009]OPY41201.1 MAG: 7-carboxy-7-deazaguanine synthase [Methanoregulaceae archaeon PtaU1.Bin066]HII75590.1 radical SAM protein [Methanolinea sp.]HNQ29499.1 radical SAM protein [Methanolinea sp.]
MKVSEIFRSIQGEGIRQGRPCTFIRFAGCNLNCSWCDTPQARIGGREMDAGEINARVRELGGTYLCITGGEPLLQGAPLLSLLSSFHSSGYMIDIETNGTLDFSPFQALASICMDVKCPSSGEESDLSLLSRITTNDSVKFVVRDEEDCRYACDVLMEHPVRGEVFFSPVEGSDARAIARFLIDEDLPARLQLQLHKILGVC